VDEIIEAFRKLSTSAISDALDRLGLAGQVFGVAPLDPRFRLVGRAFTVKYEAAGVEKGTVGDYVDDVPPENVIVLDNACRQDATVWGDILTGIAHRRGVAGTVINGVCRDTSLSLELGYPIFSCGKYMRTGKDRVQAEAISVPVSLKDVRVEPGDILVGDADGIVVVPKAYEEDILSVALQIEEAEQAIRNETTRGARLDEAREKFRYHDLQRRQR
jgi:4-hydroxy-4-methyl-2-oxoglutarate aldolase